jgi:hypothetical protein
MTYINHQINYDEHPVPKAQQNSITYANKTENHANKNDAKNNNTFYIPTQNLTPAAFHTEEIVVLRLGSNYAMRNHLNISLKLNYALRHLDMLHNAVRILITVHLVGTIN